MLKRCGAALVNILMFVFAVTLIASAVFPVHAQQEPVVEDLNRRISTLEGMNLDHRLTVIETLLNDLHNNSWTHVGTMIGTAVLIIERATQRLRKNMNEE